MADEGKKTIVEEIEISGRELVGRVQELFRDSNASRITIRSQKGDELMTLPVSFGVVAGGIITLTAPLLAAVGALAAFVTRVKLEIIREVPEDSEEVEAANIPFPAKESDSNPQTPA